MIKLNKRFERYIKVMFSKKSCLTFIVLTFLCFNYFSMSTNITNKVLKEKLIAVRKSKTENLKWKTDKKPLLLLISFDGFRWDYLKMYKKLENFNSLKKSGSHADFLKNSDPTLTFPNHYSIVTGLHPESHGIVYNNMYDKSLNKEFKYKEIETQTDDWFKQNPEAEPIWISNLKAGDGRRSAAEWIGSVAYKDTKNHHYIPFDSQRPYEHYIDDFIKLYTSKSDPINFGALYFLEPDSTGHKYGPYSKEMEEKLLYLDSVVGYLINKLKENDLFDKMNLILTSDHGMEEINKENAIYLDTYIDVKLFKVHGSKVAITLFMKNNEKIKESLNVKKKSDITNYVYQTLVKIENLSVYKRKDIPEEYHIKNNIRSGDLFVVAHAGHTVLPNKPNDLDKYWENKHGQHGYVGGHSSMHPFFISHGPAFKENYKIKSFVNVDIYPLMCYILGVNPGPNNGTLEHTLDMTRESETNKEPIQMEETLVQLN